VASYRPGDSNPYHLFHHIRISSFFLKSAKIPTCR
jgi:hypothetical protein